MGAKLQTKEAPDRALSDSESAVTLPATPPHPLEDPIHLRAAVPRVPGHSCKQAPSRGCRATLKARQARILSLYQIPYS